MSEIKYPVTRIDVLKRNFQTIVMGSETVKVIEVDENNDVSLVKGATIPTAATAGYAPGCKFYNTSGGAGATEYVNEGSAASCLFKSTKTVSTATVTSATIATTGSVDSYILVPESGVIDSIFFSGIDALAAHDTNYITWTVTNLGQAGSGTTVVLAATAANTTKATGGTALVANGKRSLTLHGTAANLAVTAGDRIKITSAASGTLANTVTVPVYIVRVR